jgi:NADPH:quinone reductase-like Zn-dependent oxidoreductase
VDSFGGPDQLRLVDVITRAPEPGFARVKVLAIGVGATDAMARRGEYLMQRRRPFTPGYELVGEIVDHVGAPGLIVPDWVAPGARVAACLSKMGGYTEYCTLPLASLIPVPDGLDSTIAATIPLDYLTATSMLTRHARLGPGDAVLINGATGGVGDALCQLGARRDLAMYGTASERTMNLLDGYPITPIDYNNGDPYQALRDARPDGVHAVFDHLGGTHIRRGYRVLAAGGVLISYAFTSRPGHILTDTLRGGIHTTLLGLRPGRNTAICSIPREIRTDRTWYHDTVRELFDLAAQRQIRPRTGPTYTLAEAAAAHQELDHRTTHGKIVLLTEA